MPESITLAVANAKKPGLPSMAMLSCLPVNKLNTGNNTSIKKSEIKTAMAMYRYDSNKNCVINLLYGAPTAFLMPTSFARLAERAVDKFMKLIQASTVINKAIDPKVKRY